MNILPSLIRSHHFLSPSVNSAVSVLATIVEQLSLLSTPNLTIETLRTRWLKRRAGKQDHHTGGGKSETNCYGTPQLQEKHK